MEKVKKHLTVKTLLTQLKWHYRAVMCSKCIITPVIFAFYICVTCLFKFYPLIISNSAFVSDNRGNKRFYRCLYYRHKNNCNT